MEFTKAQLAKIKMDNNKFRARFGWRIDLLEMINEGLIEITGEKNGELVYAITAAGRIVHGEAKETLNSKERI
jgi:hypothetical protein